MGPNYKLLPFYDEGLELSAQEGKIPAKEGTTQYAE